MNDSRTTKVLADGSTGTDAHHSPLSMTSATNEARDQLQAAADATWNNHDPAAVAAGFAEDATMRVVATSELAHGQEEIQLLAERRLIAFPDWHLDVRQAFTTGDLMCAELTLTGTQRGEFLGHPATNRPVTVEVCCVFRFTPDGKLAEETVYFDLASILGQLGLPQTATS